MRWVAVHAFFIRTWQVTVLTLGMFSQWHSSLICILEIYRASAEDTLPNDHIGHDGSWTSLAFSCGISQWNRGDLYCLKPSRTNKVIKTPAHFPTVASWVYRFGHSNVCLLWSLCNSSKIMFLVQKQMCDCLLILAEIQHICLIVKEAHQESYNLHPFLNNGLYLVFYFN